MDVLNCDAIFEFVFRACVQPVHLEESSQSYRYTVVSLAAPGLPANRILLSSHEQAPVNVRKLVGAILFFATRFTCTDESRINFLLWYADMLCKKQHAENITGLQYCDEQSSPKGLHWCFSPAEDFRFTPNPSCQTTFYTLHLSGEDCFNCDELNLLNIVADSFTTWMSESEPASSEPQRDTPSKGQPIRL